MIYRLLKNYRNAGYTVLFLVATGIWAFHLIHPHGFPFSRHEDKYILFGLLKRVTGGNPLTETIIAFVLLLLNSILVQRLNNKYLFTNFRNMLPSILFVLLTSGNPEFQALHPVWLGLPFLMVSLDYLFGTFDVRKPYDNMFKAGFFTGLGSLFCFELLYTLPAIMIGGWMLARDTRWREMVLCIVGAIIPWIFALSLYYLTDNLPFLWIELKTETNISRIALSIPLPFWFHAGLLALLTLAGSYTILLKYYEKKVNFRKYYIIFFILFLSLILASLLLPVAGTGIFIILAVPVTFLLTNFFFSINRLVTAEILITCLFVSVICLQFIFHFSPGKI